MYEGPASDNEKMMEQILNSGQSLYSRNDLQHFEVQMLTSVKLAVVYDQPELGKCKSAEFANELPATISLVPHLGKPVHASRLGLHGAA